MFFLPQDQLGKTEPSGQQIEASKEGEESSHLEFQRESKANRISRAVGIPVAYWFLAKASEKGYKLLFLLPQSSKPHASMQC